MMLIRTTVGPSAIHGVGMFAAEPVRAGRRLWALTPGFDRSFTAAAFDVLPGLAQDFVRRHGFLTGHGLWVISGDDDQYVNHADDANMVEDPDALGDLPTAPLVAVRDLAVGDELTQNYLEWDALVAVKRLGDRPSH